MRDRPKLTLDVWKSMRQLGGTLAPNISGNKTASIVETGTTVSGSLTINNDETDTFISSSPPGDYGTLTLTANGLNASWTYTVNNAAAQEIPAGQSEQDTFLITTQKGLTTTVTITVTGVNQSTTVSGNTTGSVTEDGALTWEGTANALDPDTGESGFVPSSQTSAYGSFEINAIGEWLYTLDNNAAVVQALGGGATYVDAFNVTTASGETVEFLITINGANDTPTISGTQSGTVTEDTTLTASGTIVATDPDTGESGWQNEIITGTYGSLSISANGVWNYTLDNESSAVQAIGDGATETDSFTVTTIDGTTAGITITVVGTYDETASEPTADDVLASLPPQSATYESAIRALVGDLETAGIWAKLDKFYVYAAQDTTSALQDWKDSTRVGVAVNTTFTAGVGFTISSTAGARVAPEFTPSVHAVKFDITADGQFGAYVSAAPNRTYIGWFDGSVGNYIYHWGNLRGILQGAGFTPSVDPTPTPQLFSAGRLVDDVYLKAYAGSTFIETVALAGSSTPADDGFVPTSAMRLGAINDATTVASGSVFQMSYAGKHLSDTEIIALYDAFATYLASI